MNNNRRKQIEAVRQRIAEMLGTAEAIRTDLEEIRDAEQDYRDNMPESLADGEKGQAADAAIEAMAGVIEDLESLTGNDFDGPLNDAAS